MNQDKTTISICMGSSCFPRGNNRNLKIIEEYLDERLLAENVPIKGCLCLGRCQNGSNISIGDQMYEEVEPNTVTDILNHALKTS